MVQVLFLIWFFWIWATSVSILDYSDIWTQNPKPKLDLAFILLASKMWTCFLSQDIRPFGRFGDDTIFQVRNCIRCIFFVEYSYERYLILGDYVISKNVGTVTQNYFVNINMCFKFPNNLHYYADDKINN